MNNIHKRLGMSILLIGVFGMLSFTFQVKAIYDINIKDINGQNLGLKKYKGKKLLFIIISGNEADSSLKKLSSFYSKFKKDAAFIGVPSLEDGYVEANKQAIKKKYKDYKIEIEIIQAMYTKKTSANQSELMKWLTHKEQNLYFSNEVTGAGQKFFIDETGHLYAVMVPQIPLHSVVFERILGRPKPKH
ncbi:MAG TPA: hypothetical protein VF487_15350 [Chitinophagaceae bacterium]